MQNNKLDLEGIYKLYYKTDNKFLIEGIRKIICKEYNKNYEDIVRTPDLHTWMQIDFAHEITLIILEEKNKYEKK
jgi:hypothetical protein